MSGRFNDTKDGIGSYTLANGDKRYRVLYRVNGRVKSKGGFIRKEDAKRWRDKTRNEVHHGDYIDRSMGRKLFGDFADDWLATADLRPSTRSNYGYMLGRDLACWRDVPLAKITETAVRRWVSELRQRPAQNGTHTLSQATVLKQYRLLKRILNVATREGYIGRNPCRVDVGAEEAGEIYCPTPDEVVAVADAVGAIQPQYRALVLLGGFGGLRWGEAVALKRRNVDVAKGCIQVREQAVELNNGRLVVQPMLKTEAGKRTVYLPSLVVDALAVQLAHYAESGPDGLLFPALRPVGHRSKNVERSRYLRRSNFRARVWVKAKVAAGVPTLRFHDLRHAAATLAAQSGATTKELMVHIGHSTPRAAMRYQHAADDRLRALAGRMDALLGTGREATGTDQSNIVPLRRDD